MSDADARFYDRIVKLRLYSNQRNLRQHLSVVFGDVSCAGRMVLDVGGGAGLLSFAAVQRGASRVVLLEPEQSGSWEGMNALFDRAVEELGIKDRVQLCAQTLQEFDPGMFSFDVALLHNSINHLDEEAVVDLHRSTTARRKYLDLLYKLRHLLNPGADVIICDCARRNLFGDLGLRNPLVPTIEWRKHQSPAFWAALFEEAGFEQRSVQWITLNSLGRTGQRLFSNALAAYLTISQFRLVVRLERRGDASVEVSDVHSL